LPVRRPEALTVLDETIPGWEKLARQFPDTPLYVH
jgi:hypothetical protein